MIHFILIVFFYVCQVGPLDGHLVDWKLNVTDRFNGLEQQGAGKRMFRDGSLMPLEIGGSRLAVCLIEKCGSTQLKTFFIHALGVPLSDMPYVHKFEYTAPLHLLINSDVPRVMFVRNPYVRILSGFLDKVLRHLRRNKLGIRFDNGCTFPEFVNKVYVYWKMSGRYGTSNNGHFTPMAFHCSLTSGLQYDYVLKLELQHLWFLDFTNYFNLTQFASSGWNVVGSSSMKKQPDHPMIKGGSSPCFFTPLGQPCESYYSGALNRSNLPAFATPRSSHDTDSLSKIALHYNEDAASKVSEMYHVDFTTFGYPLWDGISVFKPVDSSLP